MTELGRGAKEWGKRRLRKVLELGQRVGVDVLPRHFYSEIPDLRRLRSDRRWQRPYTLVGVRGADVDDQLNWLWETCTPELAELLPSLKLHERAGAANGAVGYGPVESDILYCLLRSRPPQRMIQIGAGASTWIALQAADDSGTKIEITCVDPFPIDFLHRLGEEGRIELVNQPVQAVSGEELSALGPGDVLFIDSTHTVSPGSDVNYVVLEVLPPVARLPRRQPTIRDQIRVRDGAPDGPRPYAGDHSDLRSATSYRPGTSLRRTGRSLPLGHVARGRRCTRRLSRSDGRPRSAVRRRGADPRVRLPPERAIRDRP